MKVISWNLNGLLSSVRNGAMIPLEALAPDVVCFQEIRTKQTTEVLPGYHHFWNPSQREGYSGTLSISKEKPLQVIWGLGNERLDQEGRVLTLEFPALFIVNCYAPNSQSNLVRHQFRLDWDTALRRFLCELIEKKPVVACGDFNVARLDIDIYPQNLRQYWASQGYASDERSNLETLLECGFHDAYRILYPDAEGSYTWWSNRKKKRSENRGWRLDYFLISDRLLPKLVDVRHHADLLGSDHCPIELVLAL